MMLMILKVGNPRAKTLNIDFKVGLSHRHRCICICCICYKGNAGLIFKIPQTRLTQNLCTWVGTCLQVVHVHICQGILMGQECCVGPGLAGTVSTLFHPFVI